jgi:hypothetical protein
MQKVEQSKRSRPLRDESESLPRYHPVWPDGSGPLASPTMTTSATIGYPSNGGFPERTTPPNILTIWRLEPRRWTLGISPVGSGANFGGFFPGGASNHRPHLPGGCPPRTPLHLSLCPLNCTVLYRSSKTCQVSNSESAYLTLRYLCARLPCAKVGG